MDAHNHPDAKLAQELLNNAHTLKDQVAGYESLITRFETSNTPDIQVLVARTMFNRAVTLADSGHEAAALAEYDRLIARYETCDVSKVQVEVAKAMLNQAIILVDSVDKNNAINECERLITRFQNSSNPEVLAEVEKGKGKRTAEKITGSCLALH